MLQLGLCEARAIDTRPDQLNEALRRALSRLVELDAEFQAKLEQLDQSTAPLPEKARWVRELQEAFRDRREPCTQLVAELRSQLRSEKCALSEPDSAERMPTTTGLRSTPAIREPGTGARIRSGSNEHHSRSLPKAISWRVLGSMDTLVLSYVITRNRVAAASIAAVETVTKIVLYYGHERAWSVLSWGREGTPAHPPGHLARAAAAVRNWCERRPIKSAPVMASAALILCFGVVLTPRPSPHSRITESEMDVVASANGVVARSVVAGPEVPESLRQEPGPTAVPSGTVNPAAALTSLAPAIQVADGGSDNTSAPSGLDQPTEPSRSSAQTSDVPQFESATPNVVAHDVAAEVAIVGTWVANANACKSRPTSFIPAVIDHDGARAGETFCAFKQKRPDRDGLNVVAACSNSRERWVAKVRLVVEGDRLKWSSQRGSQTYVKCGQALQVASG
jgi:uncharacterized membrane protein